MSGFRYQVFVVGHGTPASSMGETMRDFHQLLVWQKAHALTLHIYRATEGFPRHELYSLTSQIRRAAVSVAANVAEGAGKNSNLEFGRFLQIALGSASELEYHFLLSRDLGYLSSEVWEGLAEGAVEIKKMLNAFIQYISQSRTGTRG